MIQVHVAGAVRRPGRHGVSEPATLKAAIEAAGGVHSTSFWRPHGEVTVRRNGADGEHVRRLDMNDDGSDWASVPLEPGDQVIVAVELRQGRPEVTTLEGELALEIDPIYEFEV